MPLLVRVSFAKQRMAILSPLNYCAIANVPLFLSRAFLKILIFWGEAQCKPAIELGSTGERWEIPFSPWPRSKELTGVPGDRTSTGSLVCLKVCVVRLHKALAVLSREWRIMSFNPVPTAALDTCLACATHTKPTGALQAYSESEVQKDKKEG